MGGQDVVEYVVLQNEEGIVLASRQIDRLNAIETDAFLQEALEHEQAVTRQYEFEGIEVLEVVRSFRSDVMPSGVFRIGMSLESYRQLSAGSLTQLVILSIVLFILGSVGSYAATSSRKLRATTGSLEELQSLTDEIIESMEAAVVATDAGGKIKLFNPQAERLLLQSTRAVIGQPYASAFPEDELFLEQLHSDNSRLRRDEVSVSGPNGEKLTLLVSASPLHDARGGYSGAVALVYDITEMKRLEAHARAAERLSELGTLAAGVAHEVRNPLNAISIATQRLRMEFEPSQNRDEYESFLKTIAHEIDRLNAIIKDFLSLARSGGTKKVLVDFESYIVEVLQLVRLEAESQHVGIKLDIEPRLSVELDRAEMKKVFLNLIQNALQSTPAGGDIIIRGRSSTKGRTQLDVINNGESIPGEVRAKIFQPYFTTRPEGTGLGLAISRRIVASHGGTLELLEGEPTTFRIVV
jgi:two-component system sensor histidine kinase AtoS